MFPSNDIVKASFPPCGEGLKSLKKYSKGELIAAGKFDVCALNDGSALQNYCTSCLQRGSKVSCSNCKMAHYCSASCQKNDSKLHELECTLSNRLETLQKIPTRIQRLLLRFLKSGHDSDINFDASLIDKPISEYLMTACAVLKKYIPELKEDHYDLMQKACQLRCSCFEIGEIGIGFSDSLKKINHSCEPNVLAEFSNDSVALLALKEIQPEEQLTISYIDDPKNDPNSLSNFYHFKCKCGYCSRK